VGGKLTREKMRRVKLLPSSSPPEYNHRSARGILHWPVLFSFQLNVSTILLCHIQHACPWAQRGEDCARRRVKNSVCPIPINPILMNPIPTNWNAAISDMQHPALGCRSSARATQFALRWPAIRKPAFLFSSLSRWGMFRRVTDCWNTIALWIPGLCATPTHVSRKWQNVSCAHISSARIPCNGFSFRG